MNEIFLSYRREDSRLMCDRIYDSLQQKFGVDTIFRDIDNIPPGVIFTAYIAKAFAGCKVVLLLIGPDWLRISDEAGPRLEQSSDYVRMEIENALKLGIPIIPTLLLDADMPKQAQLPESIQDIAVFNASRIRPDPDFRHDFETLASGVARYVPLLAKGGVPRRVVVGTAVGIGVIAIGGLAVTKWGSIFGQYPNVGGTWSGSLTTLTNSGPTGSIQLVVHQKQANLQGTMTFQEPLSPKNDGTISGTVGMDGTVAFVLENNLHNETLQFNGMYSSSESALSGTYQSTHGFSGNWRVVRVSST